jgi:hypothetical protein
MTDMVALPAAMGSALSAAKGDRKKAGSTGGVYS